MSEESGRFLARWAKRKAAARRERTEYDGHHASDDRHKSSSSVEQPDASRELAGDDHPTPLEADDQTSALPDVETLGEGSDFKPFMNEGVPQGLRNQALRKLWASNPLYNHIDMLDDYCEDYTDAACVVPGLKTAYRVGKGFVDELSSDDKALPNRESGVEVDAASSSEAPKTAESVNDRSSIADSDRESIADSHSDNMNETTSTAYINRSQDRLSDKG